MRAANLYILAACYIQFTLHNRLYSRSDNQLVQQENVCIHDAIGRPRL